MRRDILCSKLHRDGITLSDDIIDFIAANVRESIRDLEGVSASLLAYSTLVDHEIDMQLAESVLSRIVEIRPKALSMSEVIDAVASFFNIQDKAICSETRSREVMMARHMASYLGKKHTECSLSEIGASLGGRTHATVLHSVKLVEDQLEHDPVMRHRVAQLEAALRH